MWLLFLLWWCCLFFKCYTCIQCVLATLSFLPVPQHLTLPFHVATACFFSTLPPPLKNPNLLSLVSVNHSHMGWRGPLEHEQPASGHTLRKMNSPFPSSQLSAMQSSPASPVPLECWLACVRHVLQITATVNS